MSPSVFRVLLNAQPIAGQVAPAVADHATLSVAVRATHPAQAEELAFRLLPTLGWLPRAPVLRVSNLTDLLSANHREAMDSAYGDYARQWLQLVHDEALAEGSSLHLLSIDYEYLDQPRRLDPPDTPGPR